MTLLFPCYGKTFIRTRYGVFATKDLGKPVLGGGTLFAATNDNQATMEFMKFLLHSEPNEHWMAKGGFLTPHKGADLSKYSSDKI